MARGKSPRKPRRSPPRDRVVAWISERITTGDLAAGMRLPAADDVAVELNVDKKTVLRAYLDLERLGLVVPRTVGGQRAVRLVAPTASHAPSRPTGIQPTRSHATADTGILLVFPAAVPHRVGAASGWASAMLAGAIERAQEADVAVNVRSAERVVAGGLGATPIYGAAVMDISGTTATAVVAALKNAGPISALTDIVGDKSAIDTVDSDHAAGCSALLKHLLSLGFRRPLLVWSWLDASVDLPWAQARERGFRETLTAAGLHAPPPLRIPEEYTSITKTTEREKFDHHVHMHAGYLAPLFLSEQAPDALLAVTDGIVPRLTAACHLLGRPPGPQLAIVGYDAYWRDVPEQRFAPCTPLATVDKNNHAVGRQLVNLLIQRRTGNVPATPQRRVVDPTLIIN